MTRNYPTEPSLLCLWFDVFTSTFYDYIPRCWQIGFHSPFAEPVANCLNWWNHERLTIQPTFVYDVLTSKPGTQKSIRFYYWAGYRSHGMAHGTWSPAQATPSPSTRQNPSQETPLSQSNSLQRMSLLSLSIFYTPAAHILLHFFTLVRLCVMWMTYQVEPRFLSHCRCLPFLSLAKLNIVAPSMSEIIFSLVSWPIARRGGGNRRGLGNMSLETQMGPKFFVMRFFCWACHSKIPNYKNTRRQKYKTRVGHYTEAYRSLRYCTILPWKPRSPSKLSQEAVPPSLWRPQPQKGETFLLVDFILYNTTVWLC